MSLPEVQGAVPQLWRPWEIRSFQTLPVSRPVRMLSGKHASYTEWQQRTQRSCTDLWQHVQRLGNSWNSLQKLFLGPVRLTQSMHSLAGEQMGRADGDCSLQALNGAFSSLSKDIASLLSLATLLDSSIIANGTLESIWKHALSASSLDVSMETDLDVSSVLSLRTFSHQQDNHDRAVSVSVNDTIRRDSLPGCKPDLGQMKWIEYGDGCLINYDPLSWPKQGMKFAARLGKTTGARVPPTPEDGTVGVEEANRIKGDLNFVQQLTKALSAKNIARRRPRIWEKPYAYRQRYVEYCRNQHEIVGRLEARRRAREAQEYFQNLDDYGLGAVLYPGEGQNQYDFLLQEVDNLQVRDENSVCTDCNQSECVCDQREEFVNFVGKDLKCIAGKKTWFKKLFSSEPKASCVPFVEYYSSSIPVQSDLRWVVCKDGPNSGYTVSRVPRDLPENAGPSYEKNILLDAAYTRDESRPLKMFHLSSLEGLEELLPYVDLEMYWLLKEKFVCRSRGVHDKNEMDQAYTRFMARFDVSRIPIHLLAKVKAATIWAVMRVADFELAVMKSMESKKAVNAMVDWSRFNAEGVMRERKWFGMISELRLYKRPKD